VLGIGDPARIDSGRCPATGKDRLGKRCFPAVARLVSLRRKVTSGMFR
jgi:hypothetical protein